ncbi:MAG: twitching motility protein [Aquificaceae bacterium]|jgi:twitching motility protein PilT|uniref:twitching motility protein n=1 Tax=Hydrogenobacter sp. Uz 6-8 TaxID=3384828 RepID=UPI00309A17B7
MNYVPHLISYLSASEDITEVYLVPKAFITEKRGQKLIKVSDALLTPEDIRDTLVALRSHTPFALGPLGREGMFSFGLQNVGRFRVKYITQRGSYVVYILKTPYHIPPLGRLCPDKNSAGRLDEILRLYSSGFVVFQGKNHALVNTLIYSLLQNICDNYSRVVFILESPLTFLLRHGQSLVIQREVGVDVDTFEEGLKDAFYMNPNVLFMGYREVIPSRDMEYMLRLAENTLLLLNMPVVDKTFLELSEPLLRSWVYVNSDADGTVSLTFRGTEPQALESR